MLTISRLDNQTACLAWLLFPFGTIGKHLVFVAYFDDSGTHDDTATHTGSEIVAVAGYVGTPSEWEALASEWNALLKREQLQFYHSVDCAHGREQFVGRDRPACNRIHRAAVEIITARNIVPIGFAVPKASFNESYRQALPEESRRIAKAAFYNCLLNALTGLALYMNQMAPGEKAAIVVEDSPKTSEAILASYNLAMQRPEWGRLGAGLAGPPTFRDKTGHPQLQAADVLAYEMALSLRRAYVPGARQRRRASWDALVLHANEQLQRVGLPLVRFADFGLTPNATAGLPAGPLSLWRSLPSAPK